jgi:pilus assembly protein CpaF
VGSRIPGHQRVLIIEDSSELKITTPHAVYFESRAADDQGKGAVTIRDLLKSALRLRPDRIIVGEVRGAEAFDLVNAMNTGHGGSMGTVHANTPLDAMFRLETLAMMSDVAIAPESLRRQIGSAIEIIVQTKRLMDGSRKIVSIAEVVPGPQHAIGFEVVNLFAFAQTGRVTEGNVQKIQGKMTAVGKIPSFMSEIENHGLPFPREKFEAPDWLDPERMLLV